MFTDLVIAQRFVRARGRHWMVTAFMSVLLFVMLLTFAVASASAKTPGSTYCFYGKCHRVKTLSETRALVGKVITLNASHYDACGRDRYNPCGLTSSGEKFYPGRADNAASPIYPDGTILLVWSATSGEAVVLRINNAGPYWGNRKLDVSIETAKKLGFARRGVAKLRTMIISAPTKAQSRYRRHRNYRKVAGYIGTFKSLKDAERASTAIMAIEAIAGSASAVALGGVVAGSRFETRDVARARARAEKETKAMRLAMLEPETRWPDFALSGEAAVREIRTARVAAARIDTANVLPGPELIKAEVVWPRRPALVLVRATNVGAPELQDGVGRDRLQLLYQISKGRVASAKRWAGGRVASLRVEPWYNRGGNRVPGPNRGFPDQKKAARYDARG